VGFGFTRHLGEQVHAVLSDIRTSSPFDGLRRIDGVHLIAPVIVVTVDYRRAHLANKSCPRRSPRSVLACHQWFVPELGAEDGSRFSRGLDNAARVRSAYYGGGPRPNLRSA
jgi:hypothetical protein